MTLNEYMELASRTDIAKNPKDDRLIAAMGMVGEATETLEHMKKVVAQGHSLDDSKLMEETGDCLWYVAKMARACGTTLEDIATYNVAKLVARYPDGFEVRRSINREEG